MVDCFFIDPDDRPLVASAIDKFRNGCHFDVEYRVRHANGNWVWLK